MTGTSKECIAKVLHAAPFADNEAGIPQMCDLIRALAAERDALRDKLEHTKDVLEDLQVEYNNHQEKVSSDFEGDLWVAMRDLLTLTGFDWSDRYHDGITAETAFEHMKEGIENTDSEITRLRAKLATARNDGWNQALDNALCSKWLAFHNCNDEIMVVEVADIEALKTKGGAA